MTSEVFANSPEPGKIAAVATLDGNGGSITSTATSFGILSALPTALQSGGQFHALVDGEIMVIPCQATPSLTGVRRGAEGTTAAAHADGAVIYPLLTAEALNNAISTSVGTETTRAETAEAANTSAITAETSRAETAETTVQAAAANRSLALNAILGG